MDRRASEKERVKPRFLLITPVVENAEEFLPRLASACSSADVAAVILCLTADSDLIAPASDAELIARVQLLLPEAQKNGATLLLDGLPNLVTDSSADGTHLSDPAAVQSTRAALKDNRIVGAGRLASRHDAMIAGEGGADYVMFGEPDADGKRPGFDAITERVAWWAELFQLPAIAYAANAGEIAALVRAGADFVALGEEALWNAEEEPAAVLAKLSVHLDATEEVQ